VNVHPQIIEAMVAHSRFTFPEEAVGLLAADEAGRLQMVYCGTNLLRSRTRYTLDPTEHFRAMRHAERNGWSLAGVFHSHTTSPAIPSPTDVAGALEPDWLYVVISLADWAQPEVRAFTIRRGVVVEVPLAAA
jgi:proteasome lid subunit RPN8/RPN11